MTQAEPIRILHLDSEMTWRGGENQMGLIIDKAQSEARFYLAAPKNSAAIQRLTGLATMMAVSYQPLTLLFSAIKLARFVRTEGIDVLDCQTSKAHNLGIIVKYLVPKVKLVVHRRVQYAIGTGFLNRRKYLSEKVDRYVPISDAIADVLLSYGVAKQRMSTVYSAVDDSVFKALSKPQCQQQLHAELGLDPTVPLIANVAYHTVEKGLPTLIDALAKIKAEGVGFQCILAGEGELTPALKAQAIALGVATNIRFLGIRNDVPRLLSAADIFCLPSTSEGLGTSILDAIHAGCAITASQVGGIPEMVIHEQTGLLFKPDDATALAKNLTRLLIDKDFASTLNERAKSYIQNRFSVAAMVSGNMQVYHSLVKPSC